MGTLFTATAVLIADRDGGVAAPAARSAPHWQPVTGVAADVGAATAAGRVWLSVDDGPGTGPLSDRIVIRSAHITSGGPTSWVSAHIDGAARYMDVLGTDLVYERFDGSFGAVGLRANGTLGPPS